MLYLPSSRDELGGEFCRECLESDISIELLDDGVVNCKVGVKSGRVGATKLPAKPIDLASE